MLAKILIYVLHFNTNFVVGLNMYNNFDRYYKGFRSFQLTGFQVSIHFLRRFGLFPDESVTENSYIFSSFF